MKVQAPPNLAYDDFPKLLDAGIDDWGGVSPVTIDHVNPEAPGREIVRLRAATEAAGARARRPAPHLPRVRRRPRALGRPARRRRDPRGTPTPTASRRDDRWAAGQHRAAAGLFPAAQLPCRSTAASWTRTRSRASSRRAGTRPGSGVRGGRRAAPRGARATPSPTSSRGTSTTRTSATSAAASAPSPRGSSAANLRGAPYVVPLEEIVRRCREAWDRGAVEVCLQGGIHPGFTGEYYLDVLRAIKSELPDLHVHAFSALEVWQGAATLGLPLEDYLGCSRPKGWPRCRGPPPRSSTTRCGVSSARTRSTRSSGSRCTTPLTARACARRRRSCSARSKARGAGRATSCDLREQQQRTGGFTEFVPLPFVHMEAPIYLQGARAARPDLP